MSAPRLFRTVPLALAAVVLGAGPAAGQGQPRLAVRIGEKDQGYPKSPKPGQLTVSGRVSVPKAYVNPKVDVLVRLDGQRAWAVHQAKLDKGRWTFAVDKLQVGTYEVAARGRVTRAAGGENVEVSDPPDPTGPSPYRVVVK